MRVQASVSLPDLISADAYDSDKCLLPPVTFNLCFYLHHGWSTNGRVDPWYQKKCFKYTFWLGVLVITS